MSSLLPTDPSVPIPITKMCDICFEMINKSDSYPLPCVCNINICWACLHRYYCTSSSKRSICPMCRNSSRYETRYAIMKCNLQYLKPQSKYCCAKGFSYRVEPGNDSLIDLENMIISITYLLNATKSRHNKTIFENNRNLNTLDIPVWFVSKQETQQLRTKKNWFSFITQN